MFGLCGCCGTESADERAKEVPSQNAGQPQLQQQQVPQQEQQQLPPSEGELAPEYSYAPEGLEGQDIGQSTSHISMKTANYGGTLERSGTSSCSRKKSDDSGDVIVRNRPPYVASVVPADIPAATGSSKSREQQPQPLSDTALPTAPSSKSFNKINISYRDGFQGTQCSCPMYEVQTLNEPPAVLREGSRGARIAKSTDDKPGFRVTATETITRREYTYNVDLPEGMHVSRRGKLVQDQGASVGDKMINQPLYSAAAACRQSAYPPTSSALQCCPVKDRSATNYHPPTFVECCAQSKPMYGSETAVSQIYAAAPLQQRQQVLPVTYPSQERPVLAMEQPLSTATCKTDKIAFKCACAAGKVSASMSRVSATKCKNAESEGLIQVDFECKRCRKRKVYLACGACYKANKIVYCKDCKSRPSVNQDCIVYVKAAVSSHGNIPRDLMDDKSPFCRDKYSKQNAVITQQSLPTEFPEEQPECSQVQPNVFSTKEQTSRAKAVALAQDGNAFVTVRCRSRTQMNKSRTSQVDDMPDAKRRTQQVQPPACQALRAFQHQAAPLHCKSSGWPGNEEPNRARETQPPGPTGIILDIELKKMSSKTARNETDSSAATTTTTPNQSSTKS